MNLTTLISSLIVSGSFGYFNYLILKGFDIINISENTKDEKIPILMLFGAMNYGIFLWIGSSFLQGISKGDFGQIAIGILYVFVLDLVATPIIIIPMVLGLRHIMNWIRGIMGKSKTTSPNTRDDFFESNKTQNIYIFDFNNSLVACGYMSQVDSVSSNIFDMQLIPFYDEEEKNVTYDKISKLATKEDCRLLIDFERKLKIYNIVD
ncbi:hypothetical protein D1B17_08830 [Companilactobacillus zhachilii]|uniref:Uncharacterized protein n=1 Tax=Companilactobacillus zhachilii TaxID=2304606 RepID=A0A386PUU3_9LACO|nr:hypothetical protein [Companilactobacillus zhachilii]AYE38729.1 hypothetical protein D1B17_08830 [Companilactobacillus zhachilii]